MSKPDHKHPGHVYTQLSTQTHINGASHESPGLEKSSAEEAGESGSTCWISRMNSQPRDGEKGTDKSKSVFGGGHRWLKRQR